MNYFHPYPLLVDDSAATAWKFQLAEAEDSPWLARTLAGRASELFPRFVTAYTELRALPRGARRSIQRRLARSRDLLERAPEWLDRREWRRLRYKLARSLAGAALLLALTQSVQAATITVTTNKPGINDGDGQCSLIEAIITANNDATTHPDCVPGSGPDTIVLPAKKIITLTAPYTNYHGYTGLPVISNQITIEGNGTKIKRQRRTVPFRLLAVSSSGDLTLHHLILSREKLSSYDSGGGIFNFGILTIENSTISGNTTTFGPGGGIENSSGDLTIGNSTISGNKAGVYGGGIDSGRTSYVTFKNSTISGNTSGRAGGGVSGGSALNRVGTLVLDQSLISGNKASNGSEIANYLTLVADNFNLFGTDGDAGVVGFTPGPSDIVPVSGVRLKKIIAPQKTTVGRQKRTRSLPAARRSTLWPVLIPSAPAPISAGRRGHRALAATSGGLRSNSPFTPPEIYID